MLDIQVAGKSVREWKKAYPLLDQISKMEEVFWENSEYGAAVETEVTVDDITDAIERLQRFAPYIEVAFPETKPTKGIIESPLVEVPHMKKRIEDVYELDLGGRLYLKCDSHLPIAGSIKARGGIYEVLKHAEELAITHGMLTESDSYAVFNTEEFRQFFSQYSIAVGSTGNLGLSIGIISAKLGFKVTVHMSADAKQWKKDKLRSLGVQVVEYQADFSTAIDEGRKQAEADPSCYFVDDEDSKDLFLGYTVAASRLKEQLKDMNIPVDADHPLFVYLPCGVGGSPGGVTFGLKAEFGEYVHCFFAEPTHSPSFLIGQMTGLQDQVSVFDFGLDNKTEADGLAVGRPSKLVGKVVGHLFSGSYTIQDQRLYPYLKDLADTEGYYLEPSALAGFYGPIQLLRSTGGEHYLIKHHLKEKMANAHHIVWATGGSMVPDDEMQGYYNKK